MTDVRVIIVDDHPIYRMGLRVSLENLGISVVVEGEFSSSVELFKHLASQASLPDIIFLDIMLIGETGIQIARELKKQYKGIRIIMLSSEVNEIVLQEIIDINVNAYLSKLANKSQIRQAVEAVLSGDLYFGNSVSKLMHQIYVQKTSKNKEEKLSDREKDILMGVCEGALAKDIACKYNISKRTVETHKANIMKKLGFTNTVDLIKYAIKEGFVSLS